MLRKLDGFARALDAIAEWTGRMVAWLVLVLVLVIVWDVAMRYLFQSGSIMLQELEWHLFALIFLLGAAYTLSHDAHVRVDVFLRSSRVGPRARALVDLLGTCLFLVPFCLLVISGSLPFVEASYRFGERSPDPGGLPYRYLLKAAIPLGFGLLLLQGLAMIARSLRILCLPDSERSAR
ncbi:MAG: TRAP transporter small permease subunit [Gammaproteobacteria bacterium]|jgi:TRAP-type mannitol/chloroaromatic compound transport system permease small subunit|nr:TRAP transporter small permease subunit [Gammaproteobacteria bacterium]